MNYFEFYGLPISFSLDLAQLKRLFYEKSKAHHPDYFTLNQAAEQDHALQMATFNNDAYKTLSNLETRIAYLLDILGEGAMEEKQALPQEFLMEMLDINEAIMDLEMDFEATKLAALQGELAILQNEINEALQKNMAAFDSNPDARDRQEILQTIKNNYFKLKYIWRIKENLSKFASQ